MCINIPVEARSTRNKYYETNASKYLGRLLSLAAFLCRQCTQNLLKYELKRGHKLNWVDTKLD